MSRYPEFDLTNIKAQPFAERVSKVHMEDFAKPPAPGRSFAEFLASLSVSTVTSCLLPHAYPRHPMPDTLAFTD